MNVQDRIYLSPPWTDKEERSAVEKAFDSGYIAPCGPQVDEFERRLADLTGRKYAVALSSGSAALDLLMEEYKVDSSWVVFAPTLTFIATVSSAFRRGTELVFVDSDMTGCIDVAVLETALEKEREAHPAKKFMIISVDLYGKPCDAAAISTLARKYEAVYISDSAEAVGATREGVSAAKAGVAAVLSFNGNKIVTTSGGGAIVTDLKGLAERAKKRSQQAREAAVHYEHKETGYNYRLSNLLASLGLAQLDKLPTILKKRAEIKAFYRKNLAFAEPLAEEGENNWLSVFLASDKAKRDKIIEALKDANIESRPVWKPMHLQPVFEGKAKVYEGKIAEMLFERGVCLPSGTGLNERQLTRICDIISKI